MIATDPVTARGWPPRRWFTSARQWLDRLPLSLIQLAMRIAVGSVFFTFSSSELTVKLFEDEYKVPLLAPALAARLTIFNNLAFPMLLFLGLATRMATLPLLGMISVLQIFVYPESWTEQLTWASILVFLLTRGPGTLSLDHAIERYLAKKARLSN